MAASNKTAATKLTVVENTAEVHNVVVCTLCSCYPIAILGLSPAWYKSRTYRGDICRRFTRYSVSNAVHFDII